MRECLALPPIRGIRDGEFVTLAVLGFENNGIALRFIAVVHDFERVDVCKLKKNLIPFPTSSFVTIQNDRGGIHQRSSRPDATK